MTLSSKKYFSKRPIRLSEYTNLTIGIDLMNYLYKYKYSYSSPKTTIDSLFQPDIGFLKGFFYLITSFKKNKINVVGVLDGKPWFMKEEVLLRRKQKTESYYSWLKKLYSQNKDLFYQKSKNFIQISEIEILILVDFLQLMGVTIYWDKTCEADEVLGYLVKTNKIDLVLSQDLDSFLIGAKKIITSHRGIFYEYSLQVILEEFKISFEEFCSLMVVSGTDYSSGIYNIGFKKSLNLLKKFKLDNLVRESGFESTYNRICDFIFQKKQHSFDSTIPPLNSFNELIQKITSNNIDVRPLYDLKKYF